MVYNEFSMEEYMMKRLSTILLALMLVLGFTACDSGTNPVTDEDSEGTTLVCLGNSLTAGFGASIPGEDDASKSYPEFLQSRINMPVINAGISGDTTADALGRLERDVLSNNPRIVIIELGANDLFHLVPMKTTQSNLQNIITKLKNRGTKIFLAKFYTEAVARALMDSYNITGTTLQTQFISQYDAMFVKLASENNIELIDDIWAGVWGAHMSDPIHPNAEGYTIMADTFFNALKPYLEEHDLLKSSRQQTGAYRLKAALSWRDGSKLLPGGRQNPPATLSKAMTQARVMRRWLLLPRPARPGKEQIRLLSKKYLPFACDLIIIMPIGLMMIEIL
jgi:acyl-CoA thioesterase-1